MSRGSTTACIFVYIYMCIVHTYIYLVCLCVAHTYVIPINNDDRLLKMSAQLFDV